MTAPVKQHLIDPEICIRCYTCEMTCPIEAITHNDDNVVVDFEKCNFCMDCIPVCPTGSIDEWRVVTTPYTLDEQFEWMELPEQEAFEPGASEAATGLEAIDDEVAKLLAEAHVGAGGKATAPASASKPAINLYTLAKPAELTTAVTKTINEVNSQPSINHYLHSLHPHPPQKLLTTAGKAF